MQPFFCISNAVNVRFSIANLCFDRDFFLAFRYPFWYNISTTGHRRKNKINRTESRLCALYKRKRSETYERSRKIRNLIFICICLIFVIPSQARTITVDDDGPADFNNIQAAIEDANDGDEIIVTDGTYTGDGNRDIDFLGKAIVVRSENGPDSCVIDCQNLSRAFYFHNGEDANSVLDGFTMTNGYDTSGGAIRCSGSSPVIADCIITGNRAGDISGSGGAIFSGEYSSPTITNCTVTGNSAGTGGAIHCYESNAAVSNCILSDNLAEIGSEIAITSTHSDLPCALTLNYTDIQGGRANVFVGNWSKLNSGPGNIDADPRFVQPGYWDHNGTPHYIWDNFWVDGDYHLLETSPCVDAGDPSYTPGPNQTDLDGNPRLTGYAVDMGAYEYPLPLAAQIHIQPRIINLQSHGKWLTCHILLPDGYSAADIDVDSILLEDEIKTASFRIHSGAPGALALFGRRDLLDILSPGRLQLTITGQLTNGTEFIGIDTIKVLNNQATKPARTRKPKVNLRPSRRTKISIG